MSDGVIKAAGLARNAPLATRLSGPATWSCAMRRRITSRIYAPSPRLGGVGAGSQFRAAVAETLRQVIAYEQANLP